MNEYFATLETEDLVKHVEERIGKFNRWAMNTGMVIKWEKSHRLYFGQHEDGWSHDPSVKRAGEQGELVATHINHYRNLIKHLMALTTSQKPAYDCKAVNSDVKSLNQTKLGANIIDYYNDEKRFFRHQKAAAERALVYGSGFVYRTWEPSLGKAFDTKPILDDQGQPQMDDQGQPMEKVIYEGDISMRAKSPFDVAYDPKYKDWADVPWICVREFENKYKLASRYPLKAQDIVSKGSQDELDVYGFARFIQGVGTDGTNDQDVIAVYKFYHIRDDAIVGGRHTIFLSGNISLYDGPMPYQGLPVDRIVAGEVFDSLEGYTDAFDAIPIQEMINVLTSIAFTNQQATGTQVFWLPDGCQVSPQSLGKGMAVLQGGVPGTEPKVLTLVGTAPEIFNNTQKLEGSIEKVMGISGIIRGDVPPGVHSGAAMGRLQAMAIQYSSNFQQSWVELIEDGGTGLLQYLKEFAKTERMISIAGKANKYAVQSFTGKDIQDIERVTVDLGNALSRTPAGRMDLASELADKGFLKDANEYISVLTTGNVDQVMEDEVSEEIFIRQENEFLQDKKQVQAMVGDKHILHMIKHKSIMNDPFLRERAAAQDPDALEILNLVQMHIMEHKQLNETQDPIWFQLSGEPMPQQPMPPPQDMPPGAPPQSGPPGPLPPEAGGDVNAPPIPPVEGLPQPPPIPPVV